YPNVENIQDIVEKHLILNGLYEIAKAYILYRDKRREEREKEQQITLEKARLGKLRVKKRDGSLSLFDFQKIQRTIARAADGLTDIDPGLITRELVKNIYDGVSSEEIERALILATISFIEKDNSYNYLGGRFFLQKLYKEASQKSWTDDVKYEKYKQCFIDNIQKGVALGLLDKRMLEYDLEALAEALTPDRDYLLQYTGVQTLYDRYFIREEGRRIEIPQAFWMRVAMGLALNETNKEVWAVRFYDLMSTLRYCPSTPTLFHAGTTHPQLSSCYLTTINDDLTHIFKCIADNAQMSKWSGGIGNDWSNIRALGSPIKKTNSESQGVVPFLKIANDVTVIAKTGKRRGGTCAYLEVWHMDIEEFLNLRKNTGDERRRTHDMNTANWIPDLFMKRVLNDEKWTLFSPHETSDLHHLYGKKFESKYKEYEELAKKGLLKKHKEIPTRELWRKMLSMLFETGHPWITFKDPCNVRSPQDHVGVIHSSNLCTEITLNTSEDETAVCNLGSINLPVHIRNGVLDVSFIADTVHTALRMLDNVIDLNFYPTIEGKNANTRHRPVGLGIMGFADALYKQDLDFESDAALQFSDEVMEIISYNAILASANLAKEKGTYPSFKNSKWDRGIFPFDTLALLEEERGMPIEVDRKMRLDWNLLKKYVAQHGMRNSNTMAIAPTATISTIFGCYPSIEPIYKNMYVKANVSGEFTIVNAFLIDDLKKLGLWNQEMLDTLKYYDGDLEMIAGIPDAVKKKYKTAFEIDPVWCLKLTATKSKWIDQSQSHNVFFKGTSGKKLDEIYMSAWKMGLKTTYYLRSMGKSQIEKSTIDAAKFGFTQKREYKTEEKKTNSQLSAMHAPRYAHDFASFMAPEEKNEEIMTQTQEIKSFIPVAKNEIKPQSDGPKVCSILDPDCESCQ
ncbi:MAG: Ribonucleotide reductase alpha subunit, partial [archaeon]